MILVSSSGNFAGYSRIMKWASAAALSVLILLAAALPGRAQQAKDAPTTARGFVVGVKEAPPFAMKNAEGEWYGISIELWREVAKSLQLTYRFAEAPNVQQLIENTAARQYDIAVAAITVTAAREQLVDFTQSYYVAGLGIAVPATDAVSWRPIVRAMTSLSFLQAVAALTGLALLTGVLIWLFERRQNEHFSGSVRKGLTSGVWWSTLAMTQRSHNAIGPQSLPGRMVAILWMVFSIIAVAVFTASITTLLTTNQLQGLVNGVGDLASVRVGTVSNTAAEETLAKMRIRSRGYATADEGLKAMQRGRIDAFVYDKPLLGWIIRKNHASRAQLLELTFDPQNYAFALPNGSPLRKKITIAALNAMHGEAWQAAVFRFLGAN